MADSRQGISRVGRPVPLSAREEPPPGCGLYNGVVNGLPLLGPTSGTYMAMITTPAAEGPGSIFPNGLPATAPTGGCAPGSSPFPDSLLLYSSGINVGGGHSELWQTVSVASSGNVQFEWNLLSNDPGFDRAFVSAFEGTGPACSFPISSIYPYCPIAQTLAASGEAVIGIPPSSQPPVLASVRTFVRRVANLDAGPSGGRGLHRGLWHCSRSR